GLLALGAALPATALGEDGAFPFPAETETLNLIPGTVTRIPLVALIEAELEHEVDLASARLALPDGLDESTAARIQLGEDSRTIEMADEGAWTPPGDSLAVTPLVGD